MNIDTKITPLIKTPRELIVKYKTNLLNVKKLKFAAGTSLPLKKSIQLTKKVMPPRIKIKVTAEVSIGLYFILF
jgi:hypothetical protein|tara:strand:+ start:419 stop:640 length:222 start_codon:yes stop_codon:yes gene_type:complete